MKAEIENIIYNYADEIPHILIRGCVKMQINNLTTFNL